MQELLTHIAHLPERSFAPGDVLVSDGEPNRSLFFLVQGSLEIRKGDVLINTLSSPGACIGEVGLLLERPATATVAVSAPTTMRVADDGSALLRSDPEVTVLLARMLAARLDLVTTFLADLRAQYGGATGSLAVVDDVLAALAERPVPPAQPGSSRDPDPLY